MIKSYVKVLGVMLMVGLFLLTGCGGGDLATILGYVYTANGEMPLAGVLVYVKDDADVSTTSNSEGYFELEDAPLGDQTIVLESGSFKNEIDVEVEAGENEISTEDDPIELGSGEGAITIKMAVVQGLYDSIEEILDNVGFPNISGPEVDSSGYVLYSDPSVLLSSPTLLDEYAIVFINCGADEYGINATIIDNLQEYIDGGNSLYASDWAYWFVESAFPDYIDFYGDDSQQHSAKVGDAEVVTADVLADDLQEQLGKNTMEINFNLSAWVVMDSLDSNTENMIEATVHASGVELADRPVMARFDYGDGQVLYTSFHNEAQNTEDMDKILVRVIYEL